MGTEAERGKRIGELAVALCGSKASFARSMDITPQNLNHWVSRGASDSILQYILLKHPNVNKEWLYEGVGKMITNCRINKPVTIDVTNTVRVANGEIARSRLIGERIKFASENLAPTKTAFADKLGESPKTLNSWIVRGTNKRNLERILAAYPVINREWLFSGYGLPFNDNPEPEETPTTEESPSISSVVTHQQKIDESIDMGTASQSMVASQPMAGEAITQTIQMLSSAISSLTAQLSDKDRIIIQKLEEIASKDERIRQLEKMLNEQNNSKP